MDGQATSARRRVRAIAWAGLLLAVTGGCNNGQTNWSLKRQDGPPKRLAPRDLPYLNGVPVPAGFKLASQTARTFESRGLRFAQQEYVGWADAAAVREFYKEQMPLVGWREISSQNIKGRLSIRFESATEECTVVIEPEGWFDRSTIQVVVQPFNRNPSEPPKKAMP